jgi:small ligand-binding sensory domain FIST
MQKDLMPTFTWLTEQMPCTYFVGGLSSSSINPPQILNKVINASFSGIFIEDSSQAIVGHTQGCEPISRSYTITKARDNMVLQLDHRPALDVLKEEVGEVLARDLKQIAGYIFAGFPIEHADTNDYLVRNIIGLDMDQSSIFIGDYMNEGAQMMFCRRDGNSAIADMERMLGEMKSRLVTPAKAALYYSCLARGRNQFGDNSEELKLIEKHLGNVPLVGFFANGEILHNRLYGYTGVLTIFT